MNFKRIAWVVVLFAISLFVLKNCTMVALPEIDNDTPAEELITEIYPEVLLDVICGFYHNEILYRDVFLNDIKNLYDVKFECRRHSASGDYYVLLSQSGTKAFVFVEESLRVSDVLVLKYVLQDEDIPQLVEHWGGELYSLGMIQNAEICRDGNLTLNVGYATKNGILVVDYGLWSIAGKNEINSYEIISDEMLCQQFDGERWYEEVIILPLDKNGIPVYRIT